MAQKRDFKYYLTIFGIATLGIFLFTGIDWITSGSLETNMLIMSLILPISFTAFLFIFDKIIDFIFPKRRKKQKELTGFELFATKINKIVHETLNLTIEDYRKLQTNDKFQKTIHQVYKVMEEGETEELSYVYLQKKFKKNTREFDTLKIFIDEAKKMKQNS